MIGLDGDLCLACGAIKEVPSNSRRWPFSKNTLPYALDMEYMFTSKNYRWFVTQTTDHADVTIIFRRIIFIKLKVMELLIVLLNAFSVKTWQALSFTSESRAFVTTRKNFITCFI